MNNGKKTWIAVTVVVAVVAVVAWRSHDMQKASSGDIKIGVAVAETGDAAEWGEGEYRIAQMYVDDVNAKGGINGQQIKLITEDTKATGVGTVDATQKLIAVDGVQAIIGPTWVDSYQGALPIAEQAKVVLLTPSAALESISDAGKFSYLFSTFWPQAPEIAKLEDFMVAHNMKSIAIINDHDPFDTELADALTTSLQAKGISLVDREQLPVDTNDFKTTILKIKQTHPDGLFIQINNVAGLGPFMQQVRQLGLSARIFASPDAQNQDAVTKFASAMEGLTYPFLTAPSGTLYEDFVKEYRAKYNTDPSTPSAIPAYNAVAALVAVLKGGARTGTEIRDALHKVSVPGIGLADVSFNAAGGLSTAGFDMKMIHDGKFVVIEN